MRHLFPACLLVASITLVLGPRVLADSKHDFDKHADIEAADFAGFGSADHFAFADVDDHKKNKGDDWSWKSFKTTGEGTGSDEIHWAWTSDDGNKDDPVSTPEPSAMTLLLVGFVTVLSLVSLKRAVSQNAGVLSS